MARPTSFEVLAKTLRRSSGFRSLSQSAKGLFLDLILVVTSKTGLSPGVKAVVSIEEIAQFSGRGIREISSAMMTLLKARLVSVNGDVVCLAVTQDDEVGLDPGEMYKSTGSNQSSKGLTTAFFPTSAAEAEVTPEPVQLEIQRDPLGSESPEIPRQQWFKGWLEEAFEKPDFETSELRNELNSPSSPSTPFSLSRSIPSEGSVSGRTTEDSLSPIVPSPSEKKDLTTREKIVWLITRMPKISKITPEPEKTADRIIEAYREEKGDEWIITALKACYRWTIAREGTSVLNGKKSGHRFLLNWMRLQLDRGSYGRKERDPNDFGREDTNDWAEVDRRMLGNR